MKKKVGTVHDWAAQRRKRPEFVHPCVLVCTRSSNLGRNSTVTGENIYADPDEGDEGDGEDADADLE